MTGSIGPPARSGVLPCLAPLDGAPSAATEVACSDDVHIGHPFLGDVLTTRVSHHLVAGQTYLVHVALWYDMPDASTGELIVDFDWDPVPANDRWVNAAEIESSPYSMVVTNAQNATEDSTDPVHSCAYAGPSAGLNSLWWTFTPVRDGVLDFDTAGSWGSHDDTVISVHTGSPAAFAEVACHEDVDSDNYQLTSRLRGVRVEAGTRYSISVSRSSGFTPDGVGSVHVQASFTPAEVALSTTTVSVDEAGATGRYDVRLTAAPSADVVVTLSGDAQCSVSPSSLTFTPTDHATPQQVTVTAQADGVAGEGAHSCTIRHTVASDDPFYDEMVVPDVTGTVTDEPVVAPPAPPTTPTAPPTTPPTPVLGLPDVRATRTTGTARPGKRVTYALTLRNGAEAADVLTVRGARSGKGFTVRYLIGRKDVTRAVTAGTYRTPSLAPGATHRLTVVVTVTRRAQARKPFTIPVTARSAAVPTATDAVRLVTRRR